MLSRVFPLIYSRAVRSFEDSTVQTDRQNLDKTG